MSANANVAGIGLGSMPSRRCRNCRYCRSRGWYTTGGDGRLLKHGVEISYGQVGLRITFIVLCLVPLLLQEIVRRRYMVVLVSPQALDGVLAWETIAVQLLENLLVENALILDVIVDGGLGDLTVPRVLPDSVQCQPLLRISRQHAGDQVSYLRAHEIRHLVLCVENLFVQLGMIFILS